MNNYSRSINDYFNHHFIRKISGCGSVLDYIKIAEQQPSVQPIQQSPPAQLPQAKSPPVQSSGAPQSLTEAFEAVTQPSLENVRPRTGFSVPFQVPEPPPFGPDDPREVTSYGYDLPLPGYLHRWKQKQQADRLRAQAFAASQAAGQQGSAQQQGAGTDAWSQLFSILRLFGINPEDIPKYIGSLLGIFQGGSQSASLQPGKTKTEGTQTPDTQKKANVNKKKFITYDIERQNSIRIKRAQGNEQNDQTSNLNKQPSKGPVLDALMNAINPTLVAGLVGGAGGALYGLYKHRKNKMTKKTVPVSPASDMLYGFIVGSMLGVGGGLMYSAAKDLLGFSVRL